MKIIKEYKIKLKFSYIHLLLYMEYLQIIIQKRKNIRNNIIYYAKMIFNEFYKKNIILK